MTALFNVLMTNFAALQTSSVECHYNEMQQMPEMYSLEKNHISGKNNNII